MSIIQSMIISQKNNQRQRSSYFRESSKKRYSNRVKYKEASFDTAKQEKFHKSLKKQKHLNIAGDIIRLLMILCVIGSVLCFVYKFVMI